MEHNSAPMNQRLWTPWFTFGVILIAIGAVLIVYRFIAGLGAVTNLSDGYPWGIWIAFDVVTGVALAAGGFTMAALVYIFNRGEYSPLVRPALLTALLGYGIAATAIVIDVGRWWQIYNPILPQYWQGNSPLFEVSICVMIYITILIIEFVPVVSEKYKDSKKPFLRSLAHKLGPLVNKYLMVFIILGIVISTLHQSSLGAVMIAAVHRIHPLWWSPFLPLMFLLTAIAVGFAVVTVESYVAARSFKRPVEKDTLARLAGIIPYVLGIYLLVKLFDLIAYGKIPLIFADWWGLMYIIEMSLLVFIPFFMLLKKSVRFDIGKLLNVSIMMIAGIILNRLNTYLFTYQPRPGETYFPTLVEVLVTAALIALLFVGYKVLANFFPVISVSTEEK
jgi:Ni/Fe-hydrogenase subunit HybB-like protein